MSLSPLRQIRNSDKNLMDVQSAIQAVVTELQMQGISESRLLTINLPLQLNDIILTHNFGRPLRGYLVCKIPAALASHGVVLSDSPTVSTNPNVYGVVRSNTISLANQPPTSISVLVF